MKRLLSNLRFLGTAFAVNTQAVLEYRVNFLLHFFGMILNNGSFALFWLVMMDKAGSIGGYGFSDVMFLWAVCPSAFGLAHVVFGNIRAFGALVSKGELDGFLLQPRDVMLNVLSSKSVVSAWGDLLYGFIVLAFLPGVALADVALFACFVVSGALVYVATFSFGQTLSFFIGESSALASSLSELMITFALYPEGAYDRGFRWVFYTIVPTAFITYVPLAAWKSDGWFWVPIVFAIAIAYVAASYLFFRVGLRRYESGNGIGART